MANGGKLEGVEILKPETWQLMHQALSHKTWQKWAKNGIRFE
jgi:hypothetical protein